jgi:agmatine deiminase
VNEVDEKLGRILLTAANIPVNTVEFIRLRSNSMWARDWCPVSGFDREGKRRFLGFQLNHLRTSAHREVQPMLSEKFQSSVVDVPLNHEGGNFICNGEGLCVTSTTVFMKNLGNNMNGKVIARILRDYAGAKQWAYLDPITGEATGHVDLFCTFVDVDKIVVGQFDPKADPVNAAELDRAAEVLSQVKTSRGPLQVFRVPMPSASDAHYRSYTNLLFANDVVVVPLFPHIDDELDRKALALFKELLPDRDVIGLDISDLSKLGGGIHCLTSNIVPATVDAVPRIPMPEPLSEDQQPVESAGLTNA